jgi:hypothetical protein
MATTTSTTEDTRYQLDGIIAAIRQACEGADFTSTSEWTSPEQCRCRTEGISCLTVQAWSGSGKLGDCQGYITHVPLSPDRALTPENLITALPEPDTDGMVSGEEVAAALFAVIGDRIAWNRVWADSLAKRLEKAFGDLEDTGARDSSTGKQQDTGPDGYRPLCRWCGKVIPASRGPKAVWCCNSHKVSACRARKRQQADEAANGVLPGTVNPLPLSA